jgi:hypothetical protein
MLLQKHHTPFPKSPPCFPGALPHSSRYRLILLRQQPESPFALPLICTKHPLAGNANSLKSVSQ